MHLLLLIGAVITWHVTNCIGKSMENELYPTPNNAIHSPFGDVVRAANQFSFHLFKTVASDVSGNIISSACDPFITLSMATHGPQLNTLQDFRTNVELLEERVKSGFKALVNKLKILKNFNYNSAIKIFHSDNSKPRIGFRKAMEIYFNSIPKAVNFDDLDKTSRIINEWRKLETKNHTRSDVTPDDLRGEKSLVVVNTVYFKGTLFRSFNSINGNRRFEVSSKKHIMVPYMKQLNFYKHGYLSEIQAQFLEIKLEIDDSDHAISMFIILPDNVDGLAQLEEDIEKVTMDELLGGSEEEILLTMPKLDIKNQIIMNEPQKNIRLTEILADAENSEGINNAPHLRVGKFIQMVALQIDGKSEIDGENVSPGPGTSPLEFNVNRTSVIIISTTGENSVILLTVRYTGSEHEEYNMITI